jgi:hypothetical protein
MIPAVTRESKSRGDQGCSRRALEEKRQGASGLNLVAFSPSRAPPCRALERTKPVSAVSPSLLLAATGVAVCYEFAYMICWVPGAAEPKRLSQAPQFFSVPEETVESRYDTGAGWSL